MNKLFIDIETNGLPFYKGYNKYYDPIEIEYYNTARMIEIGYIIYDNNKNKIKKISHLIKHDNVMTITPFSLKNGTLN